MGGQGGFVWFAAWRQGRRLLDGFEGGLEGGGTSWYAFQGVHRTSGPPLRPRIRPCGPSFPQPQGTACALPKLCHIVHALADRTRILPHSRSIPQRTMAKFRNIAGTSAAREVLVRRLAAPNPTLRGRHTPALIADQGRHRDHLDQLLATRRAGRCHAMSSDPRLAGRWPRGPAPATTERGSPPRGAHHRRRARGHAGR